MIFHRAGIPEEHRRLSTSHHLIIPPNPSSAFLQGIFVCVIIRSSAETVLFFLRIRNCFVYFWGCFPSFAHAFPVIATAVRKPVPSSREQGLRHWPVARGTVISAGQNVKFTFPPHFPTSVSGGNSYKGLGPKKPTNSTLFQKVTTLTVVTVVGLWLNCELCEPLGEQL